MPLQKPRARKLPPPATGRAKGRPRRYDESWTKVTVVLFDRQISLLDRLIAEAHQAGGRRFSRAEIIRNLVDLLAASRVRLRDLDAGEDLARHLASRIVPRQARSGRRNRG